MADADPNQASVSARANLKDTAKWIVTILGATIVLIIGGGLIAKIADLDLTQRLITAGCLLVLMLLCLIPLRAAIDIIATKLESFQNIATSPEYAPARAIVNLWLAQVDSDELATVEGRYEEFLKQTRIRNNKHSSHQQKNDANARLLELQPRITDAIELSNTEYLRLKFDQMVCRTRGVLLGIAFVLTVFFIFIHTDDQTEKQLAHPMFMQIAWSADVEAALKKAGLDEKCFAPNRPHLLQVSEKSGLRAGVLVIPKDLGPACPVVRVIVTNANQVFPDN
jgi:hypothetical protein